MRRTRSRRDGGGATGDGPGSADGVRAARVGAHRARRGHADATYAAADGAGAAVAPCALPGTLMTDDVDRPADHLRPDVRRGIAGRDRCRRVGRGSQREPRQAGGEQGRDSSDQSGLRLWHVRASGCWRRRPLCPVEGQVFSNSRQRFGKGERALTLGQRSLYPPRPSSVPWQIQLLDGEHRMTES